MLGSILLYLGLFTIEALLVYIANKFKQKKMIHAIFVLLIIVIPAVISSIRYGVGTDFFGYERIFDSYSNMSTFSFSKYGGISTEIGFYLFIRLAIVLFGTYKGFLFLITLVSTYLMYKTIDYKKNESSMSLMIFIGLVLLFGPSLNIMRQILAVTIILYGLRFIEEKKIIKYIITVIIASSFHTSALFSIFFYFLNFDGQKFSKTKEFIIVLTTILIPFLFEFFFNMLENLLIFSKYTHIYTDQIQYSNRFAGLLIRLPILILMIINRKKLVAANNNNKFYLLLYVLEFTAVFLGFQMKWAIRLVYYCMGSEIVLVPQVIRLSKGRNKLLACFYIIGYYIAYFIIIFGLWKNDGIIPYKTMS